MGRKKIQIKKIGDEKQRKVTFNRRRNGILKKAYELSILCETQVVVLMFDHKNMCHVYSSEDNTAEYGPNSAHKLMDKYIRKDFCTVDPIRNYDTSPELNGDQVDPAQAVWRLNQEKVAVVNTYRVNPTTAGHPNSPGEDDDDDADGSEQLTVRSVRTYHTQKSPSQQQSKAASMKRELMNNPNMAHAQMHTPALTDAGRSPQAMLSPEQSPRNTAKSPRARRAPAAVAAPPQYQLQAMYQGLGISNPNHNPSETFGPVLLPPQPQQQYQWSNPMSLEQYSYQQHPRPQQTPQLLQGYIDVTQSEPYAMQYLPIQSSQYIDRQPDSLQQHYVSQYPTNQVQYIPVIRQPHSQLSNMYEFEGNQALLESQASIPSPPEEGIDDCDEERNQHDDFCQRYQGDKNSASHKQIPNPVRQDKLDQQGGKLQDKNPSSKKSIRQASRAASLEPQPQLAPPSRPVTRSQSKSPQMKAAQLPPPPASLTTKSKKPMHLRGPSLLDEITFDPETGDPIINADSYESWFGSGATDGQPIQAGRESHVRGESGSQWLHDIPE